MGLRDMLEKRDQRESIILLSFCNLRVRLMLYAIETSYVFGMLKKQKQKKTSFLTI